jgi:hypothetical protein
MNKNTLKRMPPKNRIFQYGYPALILLLALSGVGQMPIFKRYYIADIPGLEWLADFYVTHYLHYLGAVLLIGAAAYVLTDFLLSRRKTLQLTPTGWVLTILSGGILMTGAFLVLRNLPGFRFPPGIIIVMDLSHLTVVMLFLAMALYGFLFKKSWTIAVPEHMKKE